MFVLFPVDVSTEFVLIFPSIVSTDLSCFFPVDVDCFDGGGFMFAADDCGRDGLPVV